MKNKDKFGLWVVVDARQIDCKVLCRCVCGTENMVNVYNLASGKTNSCGCAAKPIRARKHGLSKTPEYQIWKAIKARCYGVNHKNYPKYGGRGIRVCDRWRDSFDSFYADMGPRPSNRHSIDRIDTNGDYSPDNCRWATQVEQTRNTRRNALVTYNGETKTVAEWSTIIGMMSSTLYHRIAAGWSAERAIETPTRAITRK